MPEKWDLETERAFKKKAPHEDTYNSFGHFGVMVKNPDFIIRFRGEEWGHLGPLERELLFSGIMYMNEITVGQITEYAEKWRNEVVEVEQTSTGETERHKLSDIAHQPTPGKIFPLTGGYIEFGEDYIRFYSVGKEEIVGWTQDEWVEDPSVVLSIAHAAAIAAKDGILRLRRRIEYGVKI